MIYGKYKIVKHPSFTLYLIKPESKGSVPKSLSGSYTSTGEAMAAIDKNEENSKRLRNAKTKSDSGV